MDISELREQPHLSASGIGDYLECGLLFKFSRIDKRQPERISDSLVLGKAVHAVLAMFYLELREGKRLTQSHMDEAFDHHWDRLAHGRYDINYKPGKSYHTYREEGKALLSVFLQQLPQEECSILGIEQAFTFEMAGLPVPIIGIFDLMLDDAAGVVTVVDHKTSARAYSNSDVDRNLQMTLYHLAARANGYGDREILLRLDCLIKTKIPKFEQFYTTRSDWDERKMVKKVLAVWDGITKGVFVPNDESWKCRGCGHKTACREWFADGSASQP